MFAEEMRVVMMSFEGAPNNKCCDEDDDGGDDDDKDHNNFMAMVMAGVAPYKDMAAKAVETRFRALRESITHQACALMMIMQRPSDTVKMSTAIIGSSVGSSLIHGGEAAGHLHSSSTSSSNFLNNASPWNDASSMDPGHSRSRRMRLLDHQFRQQRAQAQAQARFIPVGSWLWGSAPSHRWICAFAIDRSIGSQAIRGMDG